jgi:putative transposase
VRRGLLYLAIIMNRAIRKVLVWRLSNTLDASFCLEALNEAITKYGKPKILNSHFSGHFLRKYPAGQWIKDCSSLGASRVATPTDAKIKISMGGRGRYLDNIFIEHLW